MRAIEHTEAMLRWWRQVGIIKADLAVRRSDGTMLWHHDTDLADLPLAWARAENARRADVYVRPARGYSWPLVFLDDLPAAMAARIARKYDSLVVHTSPQGGCHLWLLCSEALDEHQRHLAQRWLAGRIGADTASTSGEHLGRLAGFKNWKRAGAWVNVDHRTNRNRHWDAQQLPPGATRSKRASTPTPDRASVDRSPSGRDWGWVCRLLESGCDPATAYLSLVDRARYRRGSDAERYAFRTCQRAQARVAPAPTREPRERGLTHMPS